MRQRYIGTDRLTTPVDAHRAIHVTRDLDPHGDETRDPGGQGGWIPVPWKHLGTVPQPFGDLAWDPTAADLRQQGESDPTEGPEGGGPANPKAASAAMSSAVRRTA